MDANKILQSNVLDILFENRNKDYGAYELRSTYNKRITYALTSMGLMCLLFAGLTIFASSKKASVDKPVFVKDVHLVKVEDKPKEEVKVIPPKPKPQAETIKSTIPKIVPPDQAKPEDVPPPNDALDNVHISDVTIPGEKGDIIAGPIEKIGTGKDISIGKKEEEYTGIFTTVQIEAKFPGGLDEWRKFLERNLRADLPTENGAAPLTYTVVVSFVVDKSGSITDVKAENDPGYGTADEAVRVIKKSGQWIPAVQNGRTVIYRQKQKISFIVQDGN